MTWRTWSGRRIGILDLDAVPPPVFEDQEIEFGPCVGGPEVDVARRLADGLHAGVESHLLDDFPQHSDTAVTIS